MRKNRTMMRRVWLAAVVLATAVLVGVGVIGLLQTIALRATYRAEPGKLTIGIKAEVAPSYQGIELPPPPSYISEDDVPPLLEIPATADSKESNSEPEKKKRP